MWPSAKFRDPWFSVFKIRYKTNVENIKKKMRGNFPFVSNAKKAGFI